MAKSKTCRREWSCLPGCTAIMLVFLSAYCWAEDRIEAYKDCPEGWSGIRVVDAAGDEGFRTCQLGWSSQERTRFVHLTGSEAPDLFFVTIAGAKVLQASVYRKQGPGYERLGEFSGFLVEPTVWNGHPAIRYEQLMPQMERPEHFVYFLWNGKDFVPNESVDPLAYKR